MKRIVFIAVALLCPYVNYAGGFPSLKSGDWYLAWGYNEEWYAPNDIHVSQPGLNSDFTFMNVKAHDHIGWDKLFYYAWSIPQYNYRIGYAFGENKEWGIELNFDHPKYVVSQNQTLEVKGKIKGRTVDSTVTLTGGTLIYMLNNGANFFLFNLVRKFPLYSILPNHGLDLAAVTKFGVGPVVPHVQNTIFGHDNDPHFQIGGVNTGLEVGIQLMAAKHIYLEFTNKVDYAYYYGLRVYQGEVNQSLYTYELILTIGYKFGKWKSKEDCNTCPKFNK